MFWFPADPVAGVLWFPGHLVAGVVWFPADPGAGVLWFPGHLDAGRRLPLVRSCRLVLREGVDVEPHARGQVASTFSSLSSTSLRAEGIIKTSLGPFLLGVRLSVGLSLSRNCLSACV